MLVGNLEQTTKYSWEELAGLAVEVQPCMSEKVSHSKPPASVSQKISGSLAHKSRWFLNEPTGGWGWAPLSPSWLPLYYTKRTMKWAEFRSVRLDTWSHFPVLDLKSFIAGEGRLLDSLRILGIRCGLYRFKYQAFSCYQVCWVLNCLRRCWIRLMTAEAIWLLKHEVDNNTGTNNQISNTRRCLDIQWFCKSAGFDWWL